MYNTICRHNKQPSVRFNLVCGCGGIGNEATAACGRLKDPSDMEILGEIFIEIVSIIAEIIGEELAQAVDNEISCKSSFKRILIAIISGLLCWAIIGALGFATYVLFINSHPIAGFFVAITTFFFLILFISVIIKLNQIKKKK